ncbi:MAG: hypothetical protein ABRQ29_03750, partial [Smithellaceae bacterium]
MITNKTICKACLIFLFLVLISATQVSAQGTKKIAVMPFEIYSKEDIAATRSNLLQRLTAELKKEKLVQLLSAEPLTASAAKITEKSAIAAGKSLGADFVIMGSMTQFGESVSIDAKVINIRTSAVLPAISIQDRGLADIAPLVSKLKTEILVRTGLVQTIAKIEIK